MVQKRLVAQTVPVKNHANAAKSPANYFYLHILRNVNSCLVRAYVSVMENTHPTALAYLRTSSAANVGGDSDVRQRTAIAAYASANGLEIVGEFYDAAVSGADPVESRPGFAAMLEPD